MDVDVVTETVIHRPCADVSGFASDPDRAPEWYVNIKRVQWQTERPLRVGARIAFVGHFLGRRLAYTYEVAGVGAGRAVRNAHSRGALARQALPALG